MANNRLRTDWIGEVMKAQGKTPGQLARAIGVDTSEASRIKNGETGVRLYRLPDLSRFLQMPIGEIVERMVGDAGFSDAREQDGGMTAPKRDVYKAVKATLESMVRHGLAELSDLEIDECASAIALGLARKRFESPERSRDYMEQQIVQLSEKRELRE